MISSNKIRTVGRNLFLIWHANLPLLLLISFCMCIPSSVFADAGIPMIAITFPWMLALLIPIVLIETYIIKEGGARFWPALKWTTLANLVSTLIGIPLTWLALLLLEILFGKVLFTTNIFGLHQETSAMKFLMFILQAPWLGPINEDQYWMIPTATLILLLPFFIISYLIEKSILHIGMSTVCKQRIDQLCFKANIFSYGFLAMLEVVKLF